MEDELKDVKDELQEASEESKEVQAEELLKKLEELSSEYEAQKQRYAKLENTLKILNERQVSMTRELEQLKEHYRKEMEHLRKYGHEKLVKDILDVMDNFERALEQFKSLNTEDPTVKSVLIGIDMIYKDLKNILHKHGVEEIDLEGQMFDPNLAEAVETVEDDSLAPDVVVKTSVKGYRLHDKLLRAAKVIVNISKEEIT